MILPRAYTWERPTAAQAARAEVVRATADERMPFGPELLQKLADLDAELTLELVAKRKAPNTAGPGSVGNTDSPLHAMDVNPGPKAASRGSAVSPAAGAESIGGIELREIDNSGFDEASVYPARPSVFDGGNAQCAPKRMRRGAEEAKPNAEPPVSGRGCATSPRARQLPQEERKPAGHGSLVWP